MSALRGIVQLKSIAIEERRVWRLHWPAFSSQRECVWQLTRFGGRKWRSGLNRISHPDWVKLSVELNCAPNQNTKFFLSLHSLAPELQVWCSWYSIHNIILREGKETKRVTSLTTQKSKIQTKKNTCIYKNKQKQITKQSALFSSFLCVCVCTSWYFF